MLNRRELMMKGAAATALAAIPVSAQRLPKGSGFSEAVLDQMRFAAVRASQHAQQGQILGQDLRILTASLQTYFAHLDELGVTPDLESYIRSNDPHVATYEELSQLREIARRNGVEIWDSNFGVLLGQQMQAEAVKDYVDAFGLKKFHKDLILSMYDQATALDGVARLKDGTMLMEAGWRACLGAQLAGAYLVTWQTMGYFGALPALTAVLTPPGALATAVVVVTAALTVYGIYCATQ